MRRPTSSWNTYTTATSVPKWTATSNATVGAFHPRTNGTSCRWPLDETGMNSVSPWTRPRTSACSRLTVSSVPDARAVQRGRAWAGPLGGKKRDDREQQVSQPRVVVVEDPDDFGNSHRRHTFDADVVVGDERDVAVTDLQLARERCFRVLRHVDHVPAHLRVPVRLRARGEPGAFDHDDRSGLVDGDVLRARGLDRDGTHLGAVRVGERDVGRVGAVVEGRGAAGGAVDELVADDEVAALHVPLERAGRGRRQQPGHAEFVHRPKVGARRELVRRILVLETVARQE